MKGDDDFQTGRFLGLLASSSASVSLYSTSPASSQVQNYM